MDEPRFLSGWKEIANYLGKGVRTVQRYERYMGFPVRRPAGKPRAAVIATRAELDAWVAASPTRNEVQLARPAMAGKPPLVVSGLAEMHRLVEQMRDLRDQLRTSVHVLTDSIQALEGEAVRRKPDAGLQLSQTDRVYGLVVPYSQQSRVS